MELPARFGKELSLDFKVDDLDLINNKHHIMKWLRSLIFDIDMEIHTVDGKEQILCDTFAAPDMPFSYGTSVSLLLSSSNLSLHTSLDQFDTTKGKLFINVFSCKHFDYDDIVKNINKYWSNVEIIRWWMIDR